MSHGFCTLIKLNQMPVIHTCILSIINLLSICHTMKDVILKIGTFQLTLALVNCGLAVLLQ